MPVADFWDLDYPRFYARLERWEEQQYRWDLRFGVIASAYVNCKLKEGSEAYSPLYWFGYEVESDDEEEMSVEETEAFLKKKFHSFEKR